MLVMFFFPMNTDLSQEREGNFPKKALAYLLKESCVRGWSVAKTFRDSSKLVESPRGTEGCLLPFPILDRKSGWML